MRVKICILTHPLSAVAATAATPMMRRACRVCRNGTTAPPPKKHKNAVRTPACCRSITDRLACCCSTPTRTGTERTKNSSANHYTMEQTLLCTLVGCAKAWQRYAHFSERPIISLKISKSSIPRDTTRHHATRDTRHRIEATYYSIYRCPVKVLRGGAAMRCRGSTIFILTPPLIAAYGLILWKQHTAQYIETV